jgi:hypothetical protein
MLAFNHTNRSHTTEFLRHIELSMKSLDGAVAVDVTGDETDTFPASSCLSSLGEASSFFEGGSLGYPLTRDTNRLDGLLLRTSASRWAIWTLTGQNWKRWIWQRDSKA